MKPNEVAREATYVGARKPSLASYGTSDRITDRRPYYLFPRRCEPVRDLCCDERLPALRPLAERELPCIPWFALERPCCFFSPSLMLSTRSEAFRFSLLVKPFFFPRGMASSDRLPFFQLTPMAPIC